MPDDPPLLVLDANVLVRGAADASGSQAELLRLTPERAVVAVSVEIVREYFEIRDRPKIRSLLRRKGVRVSVFDALVVEVVLAARMVEPVGEPPPCRDEKDRPYLHCALTAGADFLISHDGDLLDQVSLGATRIVTPWAFLDWFRART